MDEVLAPLDGLLPDLVVKAEAAASGAPRPPEITPLDRYTLVRNDPEATRRVVESFRRRFPAERVQETEPTSASPRFAPVLHPTLRARVEAAVSAAEAWLSP